MATRILHNVRPHDTVARIGGDEFVVLCPDVGTAVNADSLAGRLLTELSRPYWRGERSRPLSVSMGARCVRRRACE